MADRPNLVIMTSHDTGRHFGCFGVGTVHSPFIDTLAREGVRYSQHFCVSPVCSPSRGAAMTGRYPQSNGLMGLVHAPWHWSLNPGEMHLAQLLRRAGYFTALVGLQHESRRDEDFEYDHCPLKRRPEGKHSASEVADAFESFVANRPQGDRPFFAQIGFYETHTPYAFGGATPDDELGVTVPGYVVDNDSARRHLAGLQGAVRSLDAAVGRICTALREAGLEHNTIVVFTVDHGIELGRAKWFCYDPGLEIALIIRWPGGPNAGGPVARGGVCDALTSNVDLLPTLLEWMNLPIPSNIQGRSFATAHVDPAAPGRDAVFAMFESNARSNRCIRTRTHKLIRNFVSGRRPALPVDISAARTSGQEHPMVELYDLRANPLELENLADDPASAPIRAELEGRLWQWLNEVQDPILHGPVATPYYRGSMTAFAAAAAQPRPR